MQPKDLVDRQWLKLYNFEKLANLLFLSLLHALENASGPGMAGQVFSPVCRPPSGKAANGGPSWEAAADWRFFGLLVASFEHCCLPVPQIPIRSIL